MRLGPRFSPAQRDMVAVLGIALGLRLLVSLLMAGTYDKNEFVYLALARDVAHGAVPYRDFAFTHPPGILVLLGFLNPLTSLWWPVARLVDVLIDSITAVLVWYVGARLYDGRAALAAGVLYAMSPIVLISAVRVDQEVTITFLSMLGIALLATGSSRKAAVLAGACLGVACWVKYPAFVFLPAYLLAARDRALFCLLGFLVTVTVLFAPYLADIGRLYRDTVTWQLFYRYHVPLLTRMQTTVIFWLVINAFAVAALLKRRNPAWLLFAFATGCVFIFTASAYPPYFVPVAPFAALLGAPLAARLIRAPRPVIFLGCAALTLGWTSGVNALSQPFVVTEHFSSVTPIVRFIDRSTRPGTPVLGDQLEFAFLARRPWIGHYFWDDHGAVSAHYLQRLLTEGGLVVQYPSANRLSYPTGLDDFLDDHYRPRRVHDAAVWVIPDRA